MQPFVVACQTCQSRLKVRSEELIGQIVPCPKCQSMVLVQPPQRIEIQPAGPATADSTAATRESIPVQPESFLSSRSSKPRSTERPADAFQSTDTFANSDLAPDQLDDWSNIGPSSEAPFSPFPGDFAGEALPNFVEAPPVDPDAATVHQDQWAPVGNPLVPSEQWVSPSTKRRRQVLMIAAMASSSLIVTVILFLILIRWVSNNPTEVAQNAGQQGTNQGPREDQITTDQSNNQLESNNNGSVDQNVITNDPTAEPPQTQDPSSETPSIDSAGQPNQDNPSTPTASDSADQNPKIDPQQPNSQPASSPDSSETAAGELPADLTGETKEPQPANTDNLAQAVQSFSPIFDPASIFATPNLGAEKREPEATPEALPVPDVPAPVVNTPPPAEPIKLQERLNLPVAGIIIDNKPLSVAVGVLSDFSGIGIGWDFESLQAAGISPQTLVKIRLQNSTVQGIIDEGFAPQGITFKVIKGAWMATTATDDAIDQMLPQELITADLASDPAATEQLKSILSTLVPEASNSWDIVQGKIEWTAEPPGRIVVYRLLSILERLRVARKLPTVSQYPADWFKPEWPGAAVVDLLDQPAQSVIAQERPVGQILGSLGQDIGISFLVDWPAVWQHGLTPANSELMLLRNRKLSKILRAVEEKYIVQVTQPMPGSLLLTTAMARQETATIIAFRPTVAKTIEEGEQMLTKLRLPADSSEQPFLVADPVSGVWFARIQSPLADDPMP